MQELRITLRVVATLRRGPSLPIRIAVCSVRFLPRRLIAVGGAFGMFTV